MQVIYFSNYLFIFANCIFITSVVSQQYSSTIHTGNGLQRGDWGPVALCPNGSYAGQMELKYEPWGSVDVTNANAVKLYCYDSNWQFVNYVTSTEGEQGTWQGIRSCSSGVYIIGYSMDVTEEQGNFGDDVGVVNIKVECEDGTILDGLTPSISKIPSQAKPNKIEEYGNRIKPFRNLRHKLTDEDRRKLSNNEKLHLSPEPRTWGPLATCPVGTKVCGLISRVERESAVTDDAGLCDMIFLCCE